MCGIFGIIGVDRSVSPDLLERATRSLAHRGPDDSGTVLLHDSAEGEIDIGLGNRRLAILDLSPHGHQPMNDSATGSWIVFNGEIYNFREIRAKLQHAGFSFSSDSDTEVILKAYAYWGQDCLAEFRGMFAFAIWDAQRHELFLARDPMGIKPLYYYQSDEYFIFSSEVRTLLGTGLVPRQIAPSGVLNYLMFGSVCDPNTLIENVRALPAAHFLTWRGGNSAQTQYFDLIDRHSCELDSNLRPKIENEIAELVEQSVRMQIVSDVPVGVFLSGGIDSSALVAILSRSGSKPSTFSIVFREADYSEQEFSRAVAQHFHTDHHEIIVSQSDLFSSINPAICAMDLPTTDGLNTFFVSERTRAAGVKVALSGLGGDEMFAGYSSFRTVPRMERFANRWSRLPSIARKPLAEGFAAIAPSSDRNRKFASLAQPSGEMLHPYFLSRLLFTPEAQNKLMAGSENGTRERAERPLMESLSRAQSLDPVNRVSYLEARCYMLNTLLRDCDFMSMAHGLEVRVPLLDHHLAKRLLALPGSWKLDSATPKPLLVRALRRELPDKIIHRSKRGFTLPFEFWLRDQLRPVLEKSFHNIAESALGALVSERACLDVWTDFLEGRTSWSRPWSLYVLQSWCEMHLQN
jgi:asparagine synthase (glutamine-hydrolysing)